MIPGAQDRVILDGQEYEVMGEPMDMSHGPFWSGPIPMPTPYEVGLRAHSDSTTVEDGYGNLIQSWGDPEPLKVCGWQAAGSDRADRVRPQTDRHADR